MEKKQPHPQNPINNHTIGASNCDGSVLGFLSSRKTQFQYNSGKDADFLPLYRELAKLSAALKPGSSIEVLLDEIQKIERCAQRAKEGLEEAELCMKTMTSFAENMLGQVDEILVSRDKLLQEKKKTSV